ncbi:hypothetical protein Lupro_09605 [Lutibacter profundi]|uniref:Uracil phosphoribosyltransferase n=1 Tax=Lutibacter profundi TaxID=1622118 RepID=A0A0X8G7H9_9FLAO|nr:hypothetical protein [Lutibacter profundi]AMC11506.1 hypothetical protein Lupro_09605 [Lutibacter profundi]
MIANNIFKAIGDFCTNVLFQPFDALRFMTNWWTQNTINWILVVIAFTAFIYWLGELKKHRNSVNE